MNHTEKQSPTIKHLVISGGGPTGFITYGALRYLAQQEFWRLSELKSIYGCSIGAFFGVIVSLGYAWDWLDDYFIRRPWEKLLNISALTFFEKKGLLDEAFITESIASLLSAKDLNINITLKELYDYNQIAIHMYATNINSTLLEKVDLSYLTHPELTVIKALTMSMCFPFLFKPMYLNKEECYIDGGLLNNFPLNDCITQQPDCLKDQEILAFKNKWIKGIDTIAEDSSVVDFLLVLIKKMQCYIDTERQQGEVKHTVLCRIENLEGIEHWINALSNEETRKALIAKGEEEAKLFLRLLGDSS
jgi:predicted acylesterase/phospholipase RssA